MERYDPQAIEAKWQRVWEDERAFHEPNPAPGEEADERHWYQLEMLPYPSGSLHMGHVLNYTMGDVQTHLRRRSGWRVLRPMGFDSFGLPAENAALRDGEHPRESTERYIVLMREQMKRLGWAIDWDREVSAHQPDFYRWTQWLFLKFFERGLAYRKAAPVNWCPNDQTVVANEYVIDGRCERCGAEVEARNLEQWFMKITDYADELLEYDLPAGRRVAGANEDDPAQLDRSLGGRGDRLPHRRAGRGHARVHDAAGHAVRRDVLRAGARASARRAHRRRGREAYAKQTAARRGEERAAQEVKTGVFTGLHAINPVNGERLPIYVADYVLMEYGTGAIMAVPAHDERDREFAVAFGLPIVEVVTEDGVLVNSGEFDGLPADEGKAAIVDSLRKQGKAEPTVSYRLRDWSFSRQRYWGSPIPIVYCDDCGIVPVPEDELPVLLPEVEDYRPKGVAPLASNTEWLHVPCPTCGKEATREADTMDTFVDSSWYFLRYVDPHSDVAPFDRAAADFWCPISQYIGGIDHATGHLLYSRFFVKVMNEMGLVGFREPFARLFHQGWVQLGGVKMSKSKGNVEGPDELVRLHGADAVRLYILFLGPADQAMEWTPAGAEGIARFLRRLWRLVHEVAAAEDGAGPADTPLARKAHETIAKVTDDIGRRQSYNTAIAAIMELVNELSRDTGDPAARVAAETAVSLIQPYAPHVAEELWGVLGHERLWEAPWPVADEAMLERETFELVVQVNGRVRDRVEAAAGLSDDELVELAKGSEKVQTHLDGKEIRQAVVVPGKLVNFVV